MEKIYSNLHLKYSSHIFPNFIALTVCIFILFSLSSCNTGSKGRYKFQSESMHWLQFRGPDASGIAPENADPPVHFSADTNLLWKTEMLPGWSSPCIVNNKIFLTGFNDSDSLLYTIAVNRENGEIIWQNSVVPQMYYTLHPVNSYANPTIASNGEMIFSHFPGYGLVVYNLSGEKVWEYQHMPITYSQGGSISPVIKDDLVIISINQRGDTRIQALDCATGDTVWAIRDPVHIGKSIGCSASPVVWNDLLIFHQNTEIVAYNMVKKTVEWWISLPTTGVSTPVICEDVLYMAAWSNFGENKLRGSGLNFEALIARFDQNRNQKIDKGEVPDTVMVFQRPESPDEPRTSYTFNQMYSGWDSNNDGAFEKEEWEGIMDMIAPYVKDHGMMAIPVSGLGERAYSEILWKINEDTPETPSPIVAGDNIMFVKNGGILTAIDRVTGEIFKKERIGASGAYISCPMLAGNRVYVCSYNGTVTVLSADDFSVLANNKLKERIGASPVAVDDVLYIRTDKHLYAFRE